MVENFLASDDFNVCVEALLQKRPKNLFQSDIPFEKDSKLTSSSSSEG